jgi:Holliday junction DNA helicase RuvA
MNMVDFFIGTVDRLQDQEIVVNVGMMGIALQVPSSQVFEQNASVKVYSYLHWNSENGPSLFGFANTLDRSVFKVIISCSGIGPKIGLAVLADLGAQGFLHAITVGDEQMLSKVSGIGKKKAEQIVVSLKHKVATLVESGAIEVNDMQSCHFYDVSLALQSLNYSRTEIGRAMDYLKKNIKIDNVTFDVLLRQALSYLSKQL